MLFTSGYENMTSRVQYAVCLLNEREASLEILGLFRFLIGIRRNYIYATKKILYSFKFIRLTKIKFLKNKIKKLVLQIDR